jgi:uncharacterized protein (TIGR02996 family)
MTTEDDFAAMLDANPDDHYTRLVFADWLQDRGDSRAEGYRAMGQLRLRPDRLPSENLCLYFVAEGQIIGSPRPFRGVLSDDWFEMIRHPAKYSKLFPCWTFANDLPRHEVEDAAALAFSRLPAERRAELLANVVPQTSSS